MDTETNAVSNADRQRAHRQRVKDRLAGLPPVPAASALKKSAPNLTRPKQLEQAIEMLRGLMTGYESWLDGLPANLSDSQKAGQLQETIEHLTTALDELEAIDPPRIGR